VGPTGSLVPAAEARYSVALTLKDLAGNSATLKRAVSIDRTLGFAKATPTIFSPNGDGTRDTIALGFRLTRRAGVVVQVTQAGAVLRRFEPGQVAAGPQSVVWDGQLGDGTSAASGFYRFAVIPAGTYKVTASDSTFSNASVVTVARGKYTLDIGLPLDRGSIHGWVKDKNGNLVGGAQVSLLRVYDKTLVKMSANTSAADGSFSFGDMWYGKYDVQAVYADQTADLPIVLDESSTSVTLQLLIDASDVTPTPVPSGTLTPTAGPAINATVTPRPPTPTPPPVTPGYLVSSNGVALGVMGLICVVVLLVMLRMRPK
jgi:hypothetical protein